MGVTVVEKGLRCFDRSPWSIISQRRDSSHDWKLRRVSAALPLKSTATCFRDLSPVPPQTLQGLEVAGQRANLVQSYCPTRPSKLPLATLSRGATYTTVCPTVCPIVCPSTLVPVAQG
jgi:hypothetical protein